MAYARSPVMQGGRRNLNLLEPTRKLQDHKKSTPVCAQAVTSPKFSKCMREGGAYFFQQAAVDVTYSIAGPVVTWIERLPRSASKQSCMHLLLGLSPPGVKS